MENKIERIDLELLFMLRGIFEAKQKCISLKMYFFIIYFIVAGEDKVFNALDFKYIGRASTREYYYKIRRLIRYGWIEKLGKKKYRITDKGRALYAKVLFEANQFKEKAILAEQIKQEKAERKLLTRSGRLKKLIS